MSDFNSDFNLGEAPQMEQAKASEMQKTLTVQEEYQQYPLNDTEKQQIEAFADKIDLYDSQTVLQYASGTQKQIADFSEQALDNVKTKDFGEVGETLTRVIGELRNFDAQEEQKGIFGFFKKNANKLAAMKTKYEKAETNIENICKVLEGHQIQLMKDSAMLDQMYDMNQDYFKQLTMYIIAGKKKLEHAKNVELPQMMEKARASERSEDLNAANDYASLIARFEKKIYDLELTRTISLQTGPQIRLIQNNDVLMSEKIQSMLVNTVPLWKSQMVIALGIEHSNKAAQAQKAVTDMTNELLTKNAENLKTATVETARQMERGVVDVETLEHTNELLISTIDEVVQIQEEGRQKRETAEAALMRMENELKQKLMEINQ
ncbi:toxic anion resistance protein [Ihubacter massiliensis]|uniref:Toxic anion resistance protein n=1 Tax=Hominibacterium faecale TaxID=2839743 RepID=A0A9J6QKI7_9FIRM|nr:MULTISPECIES: toxic anion resistance protein [Eubacteriales Family XIII. Incertae Sedis]MCO7121798.1 toxic anion resistance protein [Ihubacter massiliensis]MCU7377657.1 toxic anion resistance protein [Hominibacterium faecale]MCU7379206.1 toxic anion resistance protein [Hominibacterium faecale]